MSHLSQNEVSEPRLVVSNGTPLEHDGKELIDELFQLSERRFGDPIHHKCDLKASYTNCRAFRYDGYIIEKPKNILLAKLVIQKQLDGTYQAYRAFKKKGMCRVVKFDDKERAQTILSNLFNNPLYHGPDYYNVHLTYIRDNNGWLEARNYQEFKCLLTKLYKESLVVAELFEKGSQEFGSQKRYLSNLSLPNRNLNLYLVNFKGCRVLSSKYKMSFDDGNQYIAKKNTIMPFNIDDFNIVTRGSAEIAFKDNLINFYSVEMKGFKIIKMNCCPWSDEMDIITYEQGVNLIIWGMYARGIFKDLDEAHAFSKQILYPCGMLIKDRYMLFIEAYLDRIRLLGFEITPSLDWIDRL